MDFSKFKNRFKWILRTHVFQGDGEQVVWAKKLGIDPSQISRLFNMENYGWGLPQLLEALENLGDVMTPDLMYWLFTGKGFDPLKLPLSPIGGPGGETARVSKRRNKT